MAPRGRLPRRRRVKRAARARPALDSPWLPWLPWRIGRVRRLAQSVHARNVAVGRYIVHAVTQLGLRILDGA